MWLTRFVSFYKKRIGKEGLVFEDGTTSVKLVQGGEYRVGYSKSNPPLSQKEDSLANHTLCDYIEGQVPISSLFHKVGDKREEEGMEMWTSLVKAIGRDEASNNIESVKKVKEMITSSSCFANRPEFIDLFHY